MLQGFHPSVRTWFEARYGTPTEPQALGWPRIQTGEDTLIAAPTGSGKTLAAFLACLDAMIRQGDSLPDETQVLYVSPLKALANDVRINLLEPLAALRRLPGVPEIRAAVRTGDTPQAERQAMLRKPPHILVTTPESFYLLLTSGSGRGVLGTVRTVIVDEIHAVARDKRGAHLAISLERLDALCGHRCLRVGLSATQRPIEEIGRFLTGGRPCAIVESGTRRALDVQIEVPRDELNAVASKEQREETCERVAELIREHRTTLVFVNTRRHVERVAHQLAQRLGEDQVVAHHGSMSRTTRFAAEEKLKRGQVRCAVATASLELGIDVGAVDLVVQLESPRSFSVALQRIGRASHHRGGVPKGRLFPATRDQLVECAALVRGMRAGNLELTRIPQWPLDVLAQQLVAMAACEDLAEDEAYALVRRAWPYRELPRAEFDAVIEMHAEGVARPGGERARSASFAAVLERGGAWADARAVRGSVALARGDRAAAGRSSACAAVPAARVRGAAGRRGADRALLACRPGCPGCAADPAHPGRGAVLRRVGRDAARGPRPVRGEAEPRLRSGAAQAVLPDLRFRAAGGGHRRRHPALARPPEQLSARVRVRLPRAGHHRRDAHAGGAASSHVGGALALERDPVARGFALAGGGGDPLQHPAHAHRRSAGAGVPRPGAVPGA